MEATDDKQSNQKEETEEEKPDRHDQTNQDEMEELGQKQSNRQEETKEEKPEKQDETSQGDKVIPVVETNQSLADTKEEIHDNGDEISIKKQALEAGKVGDSQIDSSKKPKQGLKPSQKTKPTVPQPFSLATEKRMSRERRGSMDFKDSRPKLSKSASLIYKVNGQSSLGAEGTSDRRHANSTSTISTRSISKPKVTTAELVDKGIEKGPKTMDRIQVKEAETKKAQVNAKRQEREELEIIKLRKASTFKASPLPSFYHRKDFPPKPELKKIPVTRPKSPLLGQRSKSVQNSEHKKTEEKGKGVSRTITSSAKEAITKLLRTTRKSTTSHKALTKNVISTA